jgi:hypothetical protein
LAAQGGLSGTLVIGADPVLDAALRRHGLPTTGTATRPRDNALLQVLPLTLALGWTPADPQRAIELLTLPASPVPRGIARGLARALHEQPAIDSDAWRTALAAGLAAIERTDDRARLRERLAILFGPSVQRGARYPAAEILRRLELLDAWMRGRASVEQTDPASWTAAARACAALRELVEQSEVDGLSAPELERFVEEALDIDAPLEAFPTQAGLAAVRFPGGVAGPVARVVWWGFELESVPAIPALPLSREEIRATAVAGVAVPDPGRLAVAAAVRWRRPLLQASDALVLVCPRYGEDGVERHPHPLWDELEASVAVGASLARLVVEQPVAPAPRTPRRGRALPAPRRAWSVPAGAIGPRPLESPSSLGALLGCSFKWAAGYHGGIWGGSTAALPAADRLLGTLTHGILARVLSDGVVPPDEARRRAERLFDAEGVRLAAALFLPGADAARADARQVVGLAARELFRLLAAAGLEVRAVETDVEVDAFEGRLRGRPDLVVGPPPAALGGPPDLVGGPSAAVIDLKWSGARYRREELTAGTAYQLAAYSRLVGNPGAATVVGGPGAAALPPFAFFILRDQRLLAVDTTVFRQAERVPGPDASTTWRALERGYDMKRAALAAGVLEAPGNADPEGRIYPETDAVRDGVLELRAPCGFCDLPMLCGKAFAAAPAGRRSGGRR